MRPTIAAQPPLLVVLAGERDGIVSDMRRTIAAKFLAVLAVRGLLRRESG
jgi:hypothetical protein